MRMSELKGYATQDPLKSDSDIASYNNEFKDLQVQLYQISQMDFNGASLFALYATNNDNPGATYPNVEAVFGASEQMLNLIIPLTYILVLKVLKALRLVSISRYFYPHSHCIKMVTSQVMQILPVT